MRKLFFIISVLVLSASVLSAQTAEEDVIRLKQQGAVGSQVLPEAEKKPEAKRGHLGMSVGSTFSYMKPYGSFMGFQAIPSYTYALNERWSVHGGLIASTTYGLGQSTIEGFQSNMSMKSLAVFAAASYKMSDRLILHGAGVKNLVNTPLPPLMAYPSDRLSFGATYKLGDNVSIGASVHFRQGNSSWSSSPFYSPFGW